jgi:hypothetical protein
MNSEPEIEKNLTPASPATARQQCLARPWRPYQQHAFRYSRSQPSIGLGIAQEVDNFLQFLLGRIDSRDIGEGYLGT